MPEILIMVPAYNPPERFVAYMRELSAAGIKNLLVVDDGSREEFQPLFTAVSELPGCNILRHAVNLGKGRALKNAFNYCLNHSEYSGMISVDCDGQHSVEDVLKMKAAMEQDTESFFLGCRDFHQENIPFKSRFGNQLTCGVFRLLYRTRFSDTQTGLRGFSRTVMQTFIQLAGERFEFETNMLISCCRAKLPVREIPIQTIYIDRNAETHFRPVQDSLRIYSLIFKSFFLYSLSSISSFLIDILLFSLFVSVLPFGDASRIAVSTILARICSSLYNFTVNHHLVFCSAASIRQTAMRYYLLCIVQMMLSAGLVASLFLLLHGSETVIKIVVDTLLFLLSYQVQQAWVFPIKEKRSHV